MSRDMSRVQARLEKVREGARARPSTAAPKLVSSVRDAGPPTSKAPGFWSHIQNMQDWEAGRAQNSLFTPFAVAKNCYSKGEYERSATARDARFVYGDTVAARRQDKDKDSSAAEGARLTGGKVRSRILRASSAVQVPSRLAPEARLEPITLESVDGAVSTQAISREGSAATAWSGGGSTPGGTPRQQGVSAKSQQSGRGVSGRLDGGGGGHSMEDYGDRIDTFEAFQSRGHGGGWRRPRSDAEQTLEDIFDERVSSVEDILERMGSRRLSDAGLATAGLASVGGVRTRSKKEERELGRSAQGRGGAGGKGPSFGPDRAFLPASSGSGASSRYERDRKTTVASSRESLADETGDVRAASKTTPGWQKTEGGEILKALMGGGLIDRMYEDTCNDFQEAADTELIKSKNAAVSRKVAAAEHLFPDQFDKRHHRETDARRRKNVVYSVISTFAHPKWTCRAVTAKVEDMLRFPMRYTLVPRALYEELGGGKRNLSQVEWARLQQERPCLGLDAPLLKLVQQGDTEVVNDRLCTDAYTEPGDWFALTAVRSRTLESMSTRSSMQMFPAATATRRRPPHRSTARRSHSELSWSAGGQSQSEWSLPEAGLSESHLAPASDHAELQDLRESLRQSVTDASGKHQLLVHQSSSKSFIFEGGEDEEEGDDVFARAAHSGPITVLLPSAM
ncbi:hypothetical protein T484DRAFT_1875641 [Baffinella frigidus]|nr:hypothetical protein T484DRAFT_1875641 [Cryptophyta sp. CCMP2293]